MKENFKENLAIYHLKNNDVIAIPTDTIYGFSCLPNISAIQKIIQLKKRDLNKGFILLASDINYVLPYIDKAFIKKLTTACKVKHLKPTTFLVPKNESVNKLISGDSKFIAIRITQNLLIKFLCEKTNSALISTSANLQGKNTVKSLLELKKQTKDYLSFALPPEDNDNNPSTIINLLSGAKLR